MARGLVVPAEAVVQDCEVWLEAHLPEDGTLLSDIVSRIVAEGPRHVCKKTCEAALRVCVHPS